MKTQKMRKQGRRQKRNQVRVAVARWQEHRLVCDSCWDGAALCGAGRALSLNTRLAENYRHRNA